MSDGFAMSIARGHWIGQPPGFDEVRYLDPERQLVFEPFDDSRPCSACDRPATSEGYDACLGHIEGVRACCCGHGLGDRQAYVVFTDGESLYGDPAREFFRSIDRPVPEVSE